MEGVARTGQMLFKKELTSTDIEHRLHWPSHHLGKLPAFEGGHQVDFIVKDVDGKRWEFRCSKRMTGSYEKPVISSGWLPFLHGKRNKFKPGDEVIFYKSLDPDALFAIRLRRKVLVFGTNLNEIEE